MNKEENDNNKEEVKENKVKKVGKDHRRKKWDNLIDEKTPRSKFQHVLRKLEEKCPVETVKLDDKMEISSVFEPHTSSRERINWSRKSKLTQSCWSLSCQLFQICRAQLSK